MPNPPTSEMESDFVCACEKWMRSVCASLPFYGEHKGKRYCVLHLPGTPKSLDFSKAFKTKLTAKDFNFRGVWFPDELSFDKYEFLDNVDFSGAFFNSRVFFTEAIFLGANFNGATFAMQAYFSRSIFKAEASFDHATFQGPAYFSVARFAAIRFREVRFLASLDFSHTTSLGAATFTSVTLELWATFQSATFNDRVDFAGVNFKEADFRWTTFQSSVRFIRSCFNGDTDFNGSQFIKEVDFDRVTFGGNVNFQSALFGARVTFAGQEQRPMFTKLSVLDLQFATFEKADRVSFHTLRLHPHWFINVDPRTFELTNVDWYKSGKAKAELELLKSRNVASSHRLLAIASRRLAANAEDNDRYREASHFRRMALDAERLEAWRGFNLRRLNWWYWIASGYGERPFQALLVLLGILLLFGMLYTKSGFARWEPRVASEADAVVGKRDDFGTPLPLKRALTYSGGVMTLQKPEPKPATTTAQTLVIAETILGPVQAALLALAVRRKFMR